MAIKKLMMVAAVCLMAAMTFAAQCVGTTRSGARCSRNASPGSAYCWQHGGSVGAGISGGHTFTRTSGQPFPRPNKELFDKVKTWLVIIKGSTGSGSGSFIKMEDGVWLVTNEHVSRIGHPLVAITVDGRRFNFTAKSKFQVAKNRDIARLKVPDETFALNMSTKVPTIGDRIWVFGNSAGGNVLTYLEGSINGVGAYEIEVDAQFVGGNSGSPILDDNGDVIALATYATLRNDPSDWVKEGTRFNDVRRYAVTFKSIEWETVDWMLYSRQAFLLEACTQYRKFLLPVCFKKKEIVTDYDVKESALASKSREFGRALSRLIEQDKKFMKAGKEYDTILHKKETTPVGSISYPKKESIDMKRNAMNREMLKCYYERNCALRTGRDLLIKVNWCTSRLRDTAEELQEGFGFCVRTYNDLNNVKLDEYKRVFSKERLLLE